jgi:nitrogen fixation/metabolism regulation signal transduction histidine kinase
MQRNMIIMALMMALSFLAALLFTGRLQRGISEPLLELADTARRVSGGRNFSIRAATHGNDETGVLIEAFNDMLARFRRGTSNWRAIAKIWNRRSWCAPKRSRAPTPSWVPPRSEPRAWLG